ncbi:MAG TPA: PD-(D/E)XK nuclease family protein [Gaiellaceae bacterium]|nr:PD-(D/E)XK nuclease family protein [Gaiellaceae bacterium]
MADSQQVSPGFRVLLGAPARVEDAFLERIQSIRAGAPLAPIDVLVGGVLLRPYLQRLIADTSPALLNVRFWTLGELGIRLGGAALAVSGRRPLPAIAERAYVGEVARGCEGYFAPVASTPGFAEAARQLLRELRREGIDADELERVAPGCLESEAKADDLTALYRRYLEGRAELYDGEDALAVADPARFDGSELLLVGVWRLGAHARRLVGALAERVPITVFLPSVSEDADAAHAELRAWLAERGAQVEELAAPAGATALAHLQRDLFAPSARAPHDDSVDLVSAPDPLTETREAARACLAWAERGIPFREMAVAYRQAEVYRPLVEAVFAEAGIPVYLDDGPSLAERPLGRRILALLDLIDSPLRRADVMAFLSDGRMPRETRERFGGTPPARWDSISRRAGVVEGIEQWRRRLELYRAEQAEAAAAEDAPEWVRRRVDDCDSLLAFVEAFAADLAGHPERASWSESLEFLRGLLERYVDGASDVVGYLDQLAALDELVPEVEFSRFLDVVRAEVKALKAADLDEGQQGAFGRRGVNVLDVNQLRNLRFRAVAVLGLTERAFPPPPRQDPLLLDEERVRLNERGGFGLPLRARGADPEPLQFALAVAAARECLLLSTRRADAPGGRVQLPSSFFRAAAGALEGRRVRVEEIRGLDRVRTLRAGRVGAGSLERALTPSERDRTLLELDPTLGRAVLERLEPRAARADAVRRARWATRSLTPHDGVFTAPAALAALAEWLSRRAFSATSLETYGNCPYRYLLGEIFRLSPFEEPERIQRIDPLTRGSLAHSVLERFVASLDAPLAPAPADAHRKALLAILEEELAAVEARGLTGAPLLWRADRQEIVDDLLAWLDLQLGTPSPYSRSEVEVAFGTRFAGERRSALARDEPLEIELRSRSFRLAGKIDRLDFEPGGPFRVVDYKTGSGSQLPKGGQLKGGRALQLPLYILAGALLLGVEPGQGEAAYHLVSRRGGLRQLVFRGGDLEARRDELEQVLGRILDGIAGGDFHPEPAPDTCRYCNFQDLCDVGRQRIRERKQGDARVQTFADMRGIA